jgi:hypothetical protein
LRRWWRTAGLAAAIAALATQMALSLVPMSEAPGRAATSLAPVAALWGLSSLCLPSGAPGKPGAHSDPLASHGCPICQVVHQSAAFVPPPQLVLEARAPAAGPPLLGPGESHPPHPPFSTPQSRAPPIEA